MTKQHAEERWVTVSGTRLLARTWGEPRDRPLLYWHGLAHTARASLELDEAGPHFASSYGLYVVAFDVPGFGDSPPVAPEAYHPHSLVELVPPLLDALELERVAFMGSSWGGHIGCHVAAQHADRLTGLVLLDSGYRDPWYDGSLPFEMFLAESERVWEDQRAADDGVVPAVSPMVMAAAAYGIAQAPPSTAWPELAQADLPTLLIAAGDAREYDLVRFSRAVPRAVVHRASGIGHDVLADGGAAVLAVIGQWLRDLNA